VWDGKIVLWETLGFLFLYVVYIFVIVFGRYINQKIKAKRGIVPRKNDFRQSASVSSIRRTNSTIKRYNLQNDLINTQADDENEIDERQQQQHQQQQRVYNNSYVEEEDDEITSLTRPLLNSDSGDIESQSFESIDMTYKIAFIKTCYPVDINEWKKSNIFSKIMMVIKAPIFFILKITIPLVDYDIENNNWNKLTIMINCLIAPIFMAFATEGSF
jgi:hypothetical protein